MSLKQLTKVNCLLIKKLLSHYYKNKILIKPPNDLFVNKKKICGILQETITKANANYFIVGVGINLIKSPAINNYPTTNLLELTKINVSKNKLNESVDKAIDSRIKNVEAEDVRYSIDGVMATFTMVGILKKQEHYKQALDVLNLLESKKSNLPTIILCKTKVIYDIIRIFL